MQGGEREKREGKAKVGGEGGDGKGGEGKGVKGTPCTSLNFPYNSLLEGFQ